MKTLAVDIAEIAELMEMQDYEGERFLNLQTGKTVIVPSELLNREEDDSSQLPDWEKELLPVVEELDAGGDRYAPIPQVDSHEAYDDMVQFAETVTDPRLREHLAIALDGKGAFRRFKDVLYNYSDEQKRWYALKDSIMAERVRQWLRELDIEPAETAV
jgi:hypothetical protein